MSSKYSSYSSSAHIRRTPPLMEANRIMDESSMDDMPDDDSDMKSEPSSPRNGVVDYERSAICTPLKDIWLGEKHLESAIALRLHLYAAPEDVRPTLEVCSITASVATRQD